MSFFLERKDGRKADKGRKRKEGRKKGRKEGVNKCGGNQTS